MPLLLAHAAQLLTLAGPNRGRRGAEMADLGMVRDGAVLIVGERIVATGPHEAVARQAAGMGDVEELDCRGRLVTPGLVDSHTHPIFAAPRLEDYERRLRGESYAEIAAAGGGIAASVRAMRGCPGSELEAATREHLAAIARWGVTTVEVKGGYGLTASDERRSLAVARGAADALGVDAVLTYLGAHAIPPEFAGRRGQYVRLAANEMLAAACQVRGVAFADAFCDRGAFALEEAEVIFRAARAAGLGIKIHAEQLTHTGATQLAVRHGAVSADHLEQTTPADHAALAASNTVATLLPGCDLFLGTAYPPARELIAAGACVALASDFNPGTCPVASLPLVMGLACAQMRMTPAEVWTAATINGAAALGRADQVGSLVAGKLADLTIFAADDYRAIPYYLGANLCEATIQAGRPRKLNNSYGETDRVHPQL